LKKNRGEKMPLTMKKKTSAEVCTAQNLTAVVFWVFKYQLQLVHIFFLHLGARKVAHPILLKLQNHPR